ncbi:MAG: hypothetical protein SPE12_04055 [Enterocloster aldenensis]|nr:hypothetical protein [Enterocloster aldenensis]
MDKYEFNIKVEQIKKMVNKGDYETAMKIADTIDWRRVRNVNILSMVATIYEKNGEYQEAKDILLLAFERAPIGKRLLFKLAELAIKEGSIREAEDYYREFCDLAPDDPRQYILRYMILGAKGAPVEQLIHTLEQYCGIELDEKWLYELAELYAEAGMGDLCIMACDKIMLMFGLGKYVEKAMELKIQFAPLTTYQMDLVENRDKYEAKLRAVEKEYRMGKPAGGYEDISRDGQVPYEAGTDRPSHDAGSREAAFTREPGYEEEYEEEPSYSREVVYTREPGYEEGPEYDPEAGYDEDAAFIGGAGEAGYAEDRDYEGYAGEAVYAEDQEYAGGTGYAPQEGYGAEAGYAAREGYDAEAGYAAQEGHGAEAGYAAQQEHGAQAGYDAQEGYGAEAGYAEDDEEEAGVYDDYGPDDGENPPVHDQVTIEPEEAVTGHQEWMPEEDPDAMTDKALKARMHEAEVQANLAMEMSRISDQGFRREVEMAQTRVLSDIRDISKSPVRQAHHLMIEAATPQQGLEQAIESLKKIHKETGAKNQAAKITGEKINGKGVFNISDKLTGKDLIIEGAGDMTESILQELNQLMARDETGMNVVLIDAAERLAGLHRIYPGLAKRFEYIGTSTPHKEDGYEASKEDKRPVRQVQVKRQDNPQPAVRTMGRPHPAQEETKTAVQEQQPRQQTAQEMIKPERRPEQQKPVAKMQLPQPDPVQKINAADSDKVNETVPASLKKDETGPVSIKKNRTVPTSAKDETGPVSIKKNRTVPASAKDETGPVSIKKNQAVPASVKKVPEPEIPEEEEIPDDEEMDIDEFAKYACGYAGDIDCSISGKSMLALYERIEIMEEDGIPLTRVNAEDLIEEAADKAENPSFFKRLTGIFSSKYDKDGLLILKEEHFI